MFGGLGTIGVGVFTVDMSDRDILIDIYVRRKVAKTQKMNQILRRVCDRTLYDEWINAVDCIPHA